MINKIPRYSVQIPAKLLSLLLALLSAGALLNMTAAAKSKEYEINLNEDKQSYVFYISWENTDKQPDVIITSPGGKTYTIENMPQADAGEGEFMFWFASAEKGVWKVKISGEGLGSVTLDSGVMPGRMDISSFTVSVSGDRGTAAWTVLDSEAELRVEIWAAPDPVNYGGVRLYSANGNASGQCEFSLSELDSGDYYLYLKAVGSGGIFACEYSDTPVSRRKNGAPGKLDGVKARMLDDELWISWNKSEDVSGYRVQVFDASTGELITTEELEKEETQWFGAVASSVEKMEVTAAAVRSGNTGDFERLAVSRGSFDGVSVTFPEKDHLNTKTVYVDVKFDGNYTVSAALNGNMLLDSSGSQGSYRVDMEEGDNRVSFYVTDESGNIRSFGKDLYIDVTAPQLSVLEDFNGQSTSKNHVYLEGHTESGAGLTLNGKAVETENGYFSIKCPLHPGKNRLELLAADAAGNQSVYSAVVERPWLSTGVIIWILCIAAAASLAAVYIIVFIRAGRKKNK